MRAGPFIVVTILASVATSLEAEPAHVPPNQREPSAAARIIREGQQREGFRRVNGRWMRPAVALDWSELVDARVEGRRFIIDVVPSERATRQVAGNRRALVDLLGSTWAWQVDTIGRVWSPDRAEAARRLRADAVSDEPAPADRIELLALLCEPQVVRMSGAGWFDEHLHLADVVLHDDGFVRLMVTRVTPENERSVLIELEAETPFDLLLREPDAARRYLRPMLGALAGNAMTLGPGATDVYRAYPEIQPDPVATATLLPLLAGFDSPDPAERDSTWRRLLELDEAALLAALRLDRTHLSPAAAAALARLADLHDRFPARSQDQLLDDIHYLRDCLTHPDPRVREAATRTLEERHGADSSAASN